MHCQCPNLQGGALETSSAQGRKRPYLGIVEMHRVPRLQRTAALRCAAAPAAPPSTLGHSGASGSIRLARAIAAPGPHVRLIGCVAIRTPRAKLEAMRLISQGARAGSWRLKTAKKSLSSCGLICTACGCRAERKEFALYNLWSKSVLLTGRHT